MDDSSSFDELMAEAAWLCHEISNGLHDAEISMEGIVASPFAIKNIEMGQALTDTGVGLRYGIKLKWTKGGEHLIIVPGQGKGER